MTAVASGPDCLVCGARNDFEPTLGQLARCRRCGFVTWPEATGADLDQLYDEKYFTEIDYPDYLGNEAALRRSMQQHLRQMARHWRGRGTLLEIGCAYGFFLDEARRDFDRVIGVDIAATPVARARERLGVDALAGSFLELPLEERSCDVVCMWDTIEHLPRPDLFLERIRRILRPDGCVFITTGDVGSFNARLRGASWRQIHPPSHVHYFSRQSMTQLLGRTGFGVRGFETAAYYHSVYNILATIGMGEGMAGLGCRLGLRVLGEPLARKLGFWINLGDIMFVAASPTP